MAGAGYKLFNTGEVLTASDVNTYLQQQTVMVFASSAARTSALSGVLAEGMVTYLQDTNSVQVYNGTAFVAVGGSSPLTTKGDLYTFSTVDARLAVGTNGQVLTADSSEATGLKFATPAAGGGMTLIETLTLSGSSVTSSSISSSYKHLYVVGRGIYNASSGDTQLLIRFNSDTGNNYSEFGITANGNSGDIYHNIATSRIGTKSMGTASAYNQVLSLEADIPRYHNSEIKQIQIFNQGYSSQYTYYGYGLQRGNWNDTAAITTLTFFVTAGTFSSGYIYIYGVN